MSAIEKVNSSGLSADEKKALKALMGHKPTIRDQIAEDSAVDDDLLRAYLNGPAVGKSSMMCSHSSFFASILSLLPCNSSCIIACDELSNNYYDFSHNPH